MPAIMEMPASRTTDEYLGELTSDLQRSALAVSAIPGLIWNSELMFEMMQVVRPEITRDEVAVCTKRIRFSSCAVLRKEEWRISEPTRIELLMRLYRQEQADNIRTIRIVVVKHAIKGENNGNTDGRFTFECCYQLALIPDQRESGFRKFAELINGAKSYQRQQHLTEFLRLQTHFRSLGIDIPGWFFAEIKAPPRAIA